MAALFLAKWASYLLRVAILLGVALAAAFIPGPSSRAAGMTLWVTWATDYPDFFPGNGYCDDPTGSPWPCSLRAAMMEANAVPGPLVGCHGAADAVCTTMLVEPALIDLPRLLVGVRPVEQHHAAGELRLF